MAKFAVTVGGANYEVEAPDEGTAWKWVNAEHKAAQPKIDGSSAGLVGSSIVTDPKKLVNLTDMPYNLGAKVNDLAAKYVPAPFAAGLGAAANAGMEGVQMLAGGGIGKVVEPAFQAAGRNVMQRALKPGIKDALQGKGDRAVQTLLDEGVNVSRGGVEKLRSIGTDLNNRVSAEIAGSTSKSPVDKIIDALQNTRQKFANSPDAVEDFAAINAQGEKFLSHPKIVNLGAKESELEAALAQRQASKVAALQDAGRYQTMASQQQNLAHGGGINVTRTPMNEPYMNVGSQALGEGRSLSPSAYPAAEGMIGQPRIPGRYTENMQRVPEAQSAAEDAMAIFRQRRAEEELARRELEAYRAAGGSGIPIQTMQDLKQGLYRNLKDKYGTMGTAEVEAKKALANALKSEIEKGAPTVVPINKRASEIWNALNVTERRALQQGNNNLGGLSLVAHSPEAAAGMMLDRSSLAKSLLARALYSGKIPQTVGATLPLAIEQSQDSR